MNAILEKIEYRHQMNIADIQARLNAKLIEFDQNMKFQLNQIEESSKNQIQRIEDKIKAINEEFNKQLNKVIARRDDQIFSINTNSILYQKIASKQLKEEDVDWMKEGF